MSREDGEHVLAVMSSHHHSGPLPDPQTFRAYGEIEPSAPMVILEMARAQQEHDIWMERETLRSESRYRLVGMPAAVSVVLILVLGAVACAELNAEWAAAALGAASAASLAGVFIKGRNLVPLGSEPPPPEAKPPAGRPGGAGKRKGAGR